jgi:hypothetical protein
MPVIMPMALLLSTRSGVPVGGQSAGKLRHAGYRGGAILMCADLGLISVLRAIKG